MNNTHIYTSKHTNLPHYFLLPAHSIHPARLLVPHSLEKAGEIKTSGGHLAALNPKTSPLQTSNHLLLAMQVGPGGPGLAWEERA